MKKIVIFGMVLSALSCSLLPADEVIGKFIDSESNIREAATAKAKILFVSQTGEEFKVISRDGPKWLKVRLKDGREGWTNIINVKLEEPKTVVEKSGVELSDFHGTWIEDLPAGGEEPLPLYIDSLSNDKFIITSGTVPRKLTFKNVDFAAETNLLVLTLESVDEETQKASQEKWTLNLKKGTRKKLEIIGPNFSKSYYFSSEKMSSDIEIAFNELEDTHGQAKFGNIRPSVELLKSKAEEKKAETFVFKGFYLGMPLEDAKILIENYLSDISPKIESVEEKTGKAFRCRKPEFVFVANPEGFVTHILLTKPVMDALFKSEQTPRKEFLQMFVNAYQIPSLKSEIVSLKCVGEHIGSQVQMIYRSENGFEVKFYEDSDMTPDKLFTLATAINMYGGNVDYKMPGTFCLRAIEKLEDKVKNFD